MTTTDEAGLAIDRAHDSREVTLSGVVGEWLSDDLEGGTWSVGVSCEVALALAEDLKSRHLGVRLYPCAGEVQAGGGSSRVIFEVGTAWARSGPNVVLTIDHEVSDLTRQVVGHLSADVAARMVLPLLLAATPTGLLKVP